MAAVLLTGASGFVGIHVLRQLLDQGHEVRAFVRTPDKLRRNLLLVEVDADDPRLEPIQGDMTDTHALREAAAGCERAIHTAATFSYRRRDAERMVRENAAGTLNVLDAALEVGCTSVVHVSSTFALLQPNATLNGESSLGFVLGPYTQSKVDSERIARERQEAGAPVCIVNPGSVVGPNDPYLGESNTVVRDVLRSRLPTWPRGRLQWVDVRDTAEVIVAALDRPGGRYVVPGESVVLPHQALRRVTGRRLPAVRVPVQAATPLLKLGYRTDWPLIPYALEGARGIAMGIEVDSAGTVADLGIKGRSLDESLTDTIRWLVETGRISRRAAGRSLDPAADQTLA
jgi:dihydroflavonol-4-reductase